MGEASGSPRSSTPRAVPALASVAGRSVCAGPRGMWLSDGVGCCVVLPANAGALALLPRAPAIRCALPTARPVPLGVQRVGNQRA